MKRAVFALLLGVGLASGSAAAVPWDNPRAFVLAAEKGRDAGGERGERSERGDRGRESRQDSSADRRERMTEDQRRSLHRDLDKANRELYGRRPQR